MSEDKPSYIGAKIRTVTGPDSALSLQVGGSHYKDMPIQPVEFCEVNGLSYCESAVIKYVCRWKQKNGIQDLQKAKHYIDLLISLNEKHGFIDSARGKTPR